MGFCSFCTKHSPPYNFIIYQHNKTTEQELSWCSDCLSMINSIGRKIASDIKEKWAERLSFAGNELMTDTQKRQMGQLSQLLSLTPSETQAFIGKELTDEKYKELVSEYLQRGRDQFLKAIDWSFSSQNEEVIRRAVKVMLRALLNPRVSWLPTVAKSP